MKKILQKPDWDEVWKHAKIYGAVGIEDKVALWVVGIFLALLYLFVWF